MDRFRFESHKVKPDAIIAFLVGVVVAYLIVGPTAIGVNAKGPGLNLGGGGIFTTIIIVAIGGLWYTWRKIV